MTRGSRSWRSTPAWSGLVRPDRLRGTNHMEAAWRPDSSALFYVATDDGKESIHEHRIGSDAPAEQVFGGHEDYWCAVTVSECGRYAVLCQWDFVHANTEAKIAMQIPVTNQKTKSIRGATRRIVSTTSVAETSPPAIFAASSIRARSPSSVSIAGDFVETMPMTIRAPALRNRIGSNPPSRRRSRRPSARR